MNLNLSTLVNHKRVLITGFGKEGRSTLLYLRQNTSPQTISVADQNPGVKDTSKVDNWYLGQDYLDHLDKADIIFRSPGISAHHPQLKKAAKEGIPITTQTRLFLQHCKANTIGITGTAGKSSTAALVHHLLKTQNVPSVLVGNIGTPLFDAIPHLTPQTIAVGEFSSHQLMDCDLSPHVAVLLDLFQDHLDYYPDLNSYLAAKAPITHYQTPQDFLIYQPDNPHAQKIAQTSPATKITLSQNKSFPYRAYFSSHHAHLCLPHRQITIALSTPLPLIGDHNRQNILSALAAAALFADPDFFSASLTSFKPLPHRLETVTSIKGITFINDSISTTPESTIAALKALKGKVGTLIAGGLERHQDYRQLAEAIKSSDVTHAILFPDTGERLASLLPQEITIYHTASMTKAIEYAINHTPSGKICLLSPAAPSYNLFVSFEDRGDQFKRAIYAHKNTTP